MTENFELHSGLWEGQAASTRHFEGVVYFTDGRAPLPDSPGLPTLWVLTHEGPFVAEWGTIVRLPT